MKKIYFVVILMISIGLVLNQVRAKDSDLLQETTKNLLEKKMGSAKKAETIESGQIKFKVKRENLWLKSKLNNKEKPTEFAEVSLPGKLYDPPKKIPTIERKNVNRNTVENTIASVFSANKSGNLDWIVDNFVKKDKEKIRELFKNKQLLKDSQADTQKIILVYLLGQVDYKDSVFVLVEQKYITGGRVKESLALKKTENGWMVTNEFSGDEAFDIVFAAVSLGEVSLKEKGSPDKSPLKDSKS